MKRAFLASLTAAAVLTGSGCLEASPDKIDVIDQCDDDATSVVPTYVPTQEGYSEFTDPYVLLREQQRRIKPDQTGQADWGLGTLVCHPSTDERTMIGWKTDSTREFLTQVALGLGDELRQS